MTTATEITHPLTTQDIKALRTCNAICFTYNRASGQSRLDAVKEADNRNPWEQRHCVPIQTLSESYQEGHQVARASCVLRRYSWDSNPLETLLDLLRTGDELRAHLLASNNNGYVNDAGLYVDHLRLEIVRGGGKKTLVFLVEVSVCPGNTARLCQMERAS